MLAAGAEEGGLTFFSLAYHISFLSPSQAGLRSAIGRAPDS